MNLDFNFFNIVIFAGVVQGFLFGTVVLTSKAFSGTANKYLALTIISLSFNNLYYWFIDIGLETQFEKISLFYLPWHILFPVFFYLYVYEYVNEKMRKHIRWLLFIPFIVSSVTHILINIFHNPSHDYPLWIEIFYISEEYLAFILALSIGFLSFKKLKRAKKENAKINIVWLNILLRSGIILCCIWLLVYTLAIKFSLGGLKLYYPIWLGISIMFYWIGYRGLYQFKLTRDSEAINSLLKEISKKKIYNPETDNSIEEGRFKKVKEGIKVPDSVSKLSRSKSENNELPLSTVKNILKALDNFEQEKLFLEKDLTLNTLAKKLNTNSSYLSKVINTYKHKNFATYLNELRIHHAVYMLHNEDKLHLYTIEAIADIMGYNNGESFSLAFRKITGFYPSHFIRQLRKKGS